MPICDLRYQESAFQARNFHAPFSTHRRARISHGSDYRFCIIASCACFRIAIIYRIIIVRIASSISNFHLPELSNLFDSVQGKGATMKTELIVNPTSARGTMQKRWHEVQATLRAEGFEYQAVFTERAGSAGRRRQAAPQGPPVPRARAPEPA